jgi:hypothetical protein
MKKILFIVLLLFFLSFKPSFAEFGDMVIPTDSISPTPIPSPTMVDYPLPYPGVLPGSPMYFLKEARDSIFETMTIDSLKKSNRYLSQADKRLATAIVIFERGDIEGAELLISKSLISLNKSLDKAIETKKSGDNIYDILPKIKMSSLKQQQEIKILIEKTTGENRQKLENDYKKAVELEKLANQIQ